jgi:hypothetical protein
MRIFALATTTYLWTINLLYFLTRGTFRSPDRWGDLYTVLLASYASAPELKSMLSGTEPERPGSWQERVRKGAPIIGLWLGLLLAAGAWRIYDSSRPMPPELKAITMQVIGVFFGTYALRQYRRSRGRRTAAPAAEDGSEDLAKAQVLDFLQSSGPANPKAISEGTGIPRRTLTRILKDLLAEGELTRKGDSPHDPFALFSRRS